MSHCGTTGCLVFRYSDATPEASWKAESGDTKMSEVIQTRFQAWLNFLTHLYSDPHQQTCVDKLDIV